MPTATTVTATTEAAVATVAVVAAILLAVVALVTVVEPCAGAVPVLEYFTFTSVCLRIVLPTYFSLSSPSGNLFSFCGIVSLF